MNKKECVETLQKRADYLASRIANSHKDLSYDKRELSALKFALFAVENYYPERKHEERASFEVLREE